MRCAIIHYDRTRIEFVKSTLARAVSNIEQFISIPEDWFDSLAKAHDLLHEHYDLVVIPLSLPEFAALYIAEIAHATKSTTRLILYSGTNPFMELETLFDYFWWSAVPLRDRDIEDLRAVLTRPPRRLEMSEVQTLIETVLGLASCFHGASIGDYRAVTMPSKLSHP